MHLKLPFNKILSTSSISRFRQQIYDSAFFQLCTRSMEREREGGTAVLFDRGWVCPLEDFLHRPTIQDKYQIFVIDLEALMVFI